MRKLSIALLGYLTVLLTPLAASIGGGQQPELLDVNRAAIMASGVRNLSLDSESRTALEKSLRAYDYKTAEAILLKELDHNPKSPQLLTFLGGVFFLDRKYLNSAVAMKKADALAALDDKSRFTLAMAYITLNHRDWARPELEKLAHSSPESALYPYWLSRLDYDAMDFKSGVRHAQKALQLNPDFMKAYDNIGLCYEALGQYQEAIRAYRRAVLLNHKYRPCSPWPALNLGSLLIKLNRTEEAEESLNQSIECNARFSRAHYEMGLLQERQSKRDQAITELQQAVSLEPGYAEPYYVLGRIYQREGDTKRATEALASFQKLKGGGPHVQPQ